MRWLCHIGIHSYGTYWGNIAPATGGGPRFVRERCRRCLHEKLTRNWRR